MTGQQEGLIRVVAPSIVQEATWNEAEILGAMVWLWNKNPSYKVSALDSALAVLLPIIRSKNFALVSNDDRPIGYINWAFFNAEEENLYLTKTRDYVSFVNCKQVDQSKKLWILSFFCPFGLHDVLLTKSICKKVLKNHLCFYGYHKSKNETVVRNIQC
jgi:cytolysin-activating lysine-acyltransferase